MAIITDQFTFIRQSWRVYVSVAHIAGNFIDINKTFLMKVSEQLTFSSKAYLHLCHPVLLLHRYLGMVVEDKSCAWKHSVT